MLNAEQIARLPTEQRDKYRLLEKLFEQPGFKYLKEWAQAQVNEQTVRILNAATWEQHLVARGAQLAYQNFVNVEELTYMEFAQMADETSADEAVSLEQLEVDDELANE